MILFIKIIAINYKQTFIHKIHLIVSKSIIFKKNKEKDV